MFNYQNLNDFEFEALCKDIMEKKLSTELRFFSKGRDGGIDLTDNSVTHNIIIRVKHYIGSKFSNLRISLNKEIANVQKWSPQQYYICCGMTLTDTNTREIYKMFSAYMDSDKNVISLMEIDEFLQKPENSDIVRKHYKLWLYASNILNEIYNQDVFIDCDALLSDIKEESKYFVQTSIYDQCIDYLSKNGLLMITGTPGIGKTITSKMLILYYASQNYQVRYTTNGDIANIKKSLSRDKDFKEIILLDDCLGQHYFHMNHTQENELISLMKFVKLYKNKKIILNSRITIFNEAKDRSDEFDVFFQEKKVRNYIIELDDISILEKAKIFYNHLLFKNVRAEYIKSIKVNKRYLKIVQHRNYTPRIIDHVTLSSNYLQKTPESYFDYIWDSLSLPHDIWKNEFERRLQSVDRAFISTLYSLTDTTVNYNTLKKCFDTRLSRMTTIDHTINNFEIVISRLNQSVINIVDNCGLMHVGVVNPSVNDYMKHIFSANSLELNEVKKSINHYCQFERCYKEEELSDLFYQLLLDGDIAEIEFSSSREKNYFIVSFICQFKIYQYKYRQNIICYLHNSYGYYCPYANNWLKHEDVLALLLGNDLYSYYSLSELISEKNCIHDILLDLDLDQLIITINLLLERYQSSNIDVSYFNSDCQTAVNDAVQSYINGIDIGEYCENYDMQDLISSNTRICTDDQYEESVIDHEAVIQSLKEWLFEDIVNDVLEKLSKIKIVFSLDVHKLVEDNLVLTEVESIVDSYFEPDEDFYYEQHRIKQIEDKLSFSDLAEIERIFE